ncbi:sensor histidine kinase [Undibacterium sp. SXout11W]|uniref:sensor histidine kinase n=1 Tax=Undibacterium sp. SXout11W TaxID=3413050 RepID=UPI003BF0D7DF
MKLRVKSLKTQLALWVFLPTVLISFVDLLMGYHDADRIATLVQEQLLKGSARTISEQLEKVDDNYEIRIPPAAFELFSNEYKDHIYFTVRTGNGKLVAGNEELLPYTGTLQMEQGYYYLSTIRGEAVRVIAYEQMLANGVGNETSITQVAQTLNSHHAFRRSLFVRTIREHLILLAIVILGLMIALRWMMQPLIQFGELLMRRPTGSLESLSVDDTPSELQPVIFAINDYVTRLNKTLSSYEQFVANTAHQLRTSFSIINSQVDFAKRNPTNGVQQQQVLADIKSTIASGSKVINQLLILAAAEQNQANTSQGRLLNVSEVIKQVVVDMALLAQQKDLDLGIDTLDERICLRASPYLLRELIANLVDNAIQHIHAGGMITLTLVLEDQQAVLRVIDNGPGIAPEHREKVFERFYRVNEEKSNSSGLGLAIAKSICDSLSASIRLTGVDQGSGLQVEVRFPAQ